MSSRVARSPTAPNSGPPTSARRGIVANATAVSTPKTRPRSAAGTRS